ncbi:MAG: aminoglycoside phosphotransferase family protein [Anaerolineales bacterium]|nr:aminoglycoside phosphotransferase family protein [Anaerolineales bacterium]MCA9929744.1 aminoglycoside phosphotransferase family protein [Anaerolineales bacterium]
MPFSTERLTSLIYHHRPHIQGDLTFTPIETGKFNTSFFVKCADQEMVLRIAPPRDAMFVFYERDMMRQEPQLHTLIRAETTVPVARVFAFDKSQTLIDRDYILMERLPGRPLTEMGHVDYAHVLLQVGDYLAQVHALKATQYGYLGAHKPMEAQRNWVDAFAIMWHKMIDDIADIGFYDKAESINMRRLLDRFLPLFDRPVAAGLLHMDIWHQNILVDDDGCVTGIVDWDRALWGDPEIEFAVLDYCGISEPAFWEGYGVNRDQSQAAQIRRIFYLLYEVQKYIVIRYGRSHNPAAAHQYKRQVIQIIAQSQLDSL